MCRVEPCPAILWPWAQDFRNILLDFQLVRPSWLVVAPGIASCCEIQSLLNQVGSIAQSQDRDQEIDRPHSSKAKLANIEFELAIHCLPLRLLRCVCALSQTVVTGTGTAASGKVTAAGSWIFPKIEGNFFWPHSLSSNFSLTLSVCPLVGGVWMCVCVRGKASSVAKIVSTSNLLFLEKRRREMNRDWMGFSARSNTAYAMVPVGLCSIWAQKRATICAADESSLNWYSRLRGCGQRRRRPLARKDLVSWRPSFPASLSPWSGLVVVAWCENPEPPEGSAANVDSISARTYIAVGLFKHPSLTICVSKRQPKEPDDVANLVIKCSRGWMAVSLISLTSLQPTGRRGWTFLFFKLGLRSYKKTKANLSNFKLALR